MPQRTFTSDFSFDLDASTRLNIPAGWSGEVTDEVAEAADEAGATEAPVKTKSKKAGATEAPAGDPTTDQAPA